MNDSIKQNLVCLACGSTQIRLALDLGSQPLANSYRDSPGADDAYPLAVTVCDNCHHVQLTHTVDPSIIYKNYLYVSGTSNTLKEYSDWFAGFCREYAEYSGSVLDIGCNDGTQLNYFADRGVETFGIDPAENIHRDRDSRHQVVCDFFGPGAIPRLQQNSYDIITAQNVFAHNPSPVDFLRSCRELMHDDTLLFIQTSQADMILNDEFDTIYHEHINFFNARSMKLCAERANLNLIDVIKTPIHGTSYVFVLSRTKRRDYHVENILALEAARGLQTDLTYVLWRQTVTKNLDNLVSVINDHRREGYVLAGYGAAAKGMTLLNSRGIQLDFIVDDSPLKQNKFTPGTNTPIVSVDRLREYTEDDRILFVPLAWNFFTEIRQRILKVRSNPADRFVKYFPEVIITQ